MTPDAAGIEAALAAGLDLFDGEHEYPVETDDGLVMRCACGATPPSHLLGQQVDEGLWLWQHYRTARAAALLPVVTQAQAEAWDEGYARGVRDEAGDIERADNPYRARADESGA